MLNNEHRSGENVREARPMRPGDRIGPYRIKGPLGKGGMGEVMVAYDERLDRRVAIKFVNRDSASSNATVGRQRLRREARAAAGLSHPSIVQVFDILDAGDGDAIVMELVEGYTVAQCLEQGPMALHQVLRLGRQVAEGLAEAHRMGLVHRDLKTENVMVTSPGGDLPTHPSTSWSSAGRAKILDFGLVKSLTQPSSEETLVAGRLDSTLTGQGVVLGTARTMSPEQAAGAQVDRRSDLFSFGVLLYEMLTRQSPFRSASVAETLRRVLVETPRTIRTLRRDVPVELDSLVARLLEKEPDRRPDNAADVAQTLADIAARLPAELLSADSAATSSKSLSDAPTGSYTAGSSQVPTQNSPDDTGDRIASAPRTPLLRWLAGALGLVVLVLAIGLWMHRTAGSSEPLRVVVARPEIITAEPSDELDLIASGVRIALLSGLANLEGVAPIEPSGIEATAGTPRSIALAVAADEVFAADIERQDGNAWISLRRIRSIDGEILWAHSFDVPHRPSAAPLVAEAVAVQLRRAFPEKSLRPNLPRLEATDADYTAFVLILQSIESGDAAWAPELARLEAISERAPGFMAAHLQGAATAWALYSDTRETDYLARSDRLLARARALAPSDTRTIFWTFKVALDRGERHAAEVALAKLVEVAPNTVSIPLGRASLAERDGKLGAAVAAMRTVVERWPSWQNLHRLAELELRRGDVADARRHLRELTVLLPANSWGLASLARLELFYGDLTRAADLYQQAIALKPHRSYYTNLGLTHFMLGHYGAARASYRRALELQPGNLIVRFNLADTEMALGDTAAAQARYRRILEELEGRQLDAAERMTMAQCLAHIDEAQRAVAVTLDTLQRHPEDLEVVYQAALVYVLVGDVASALVNAEKALAQGYQPRWFTIPDFDPLRGDPRFQALLANASEPAA